ncbi:MAG: nucleotidyltransferase family protein [Magnetospirillum sp.]|nr:nucleotidyltransferase family protein [Magnetospirillum sp.]
MWTGRLTSAARPGAALGLVLAAAAAHWSGRAASVPAAFDPAEVVALIRRHRIATLTLTKAAGLPAALTEAIAAASAGQIRRAALLALECARVAHHLTGSGQDFLVVKGAPLSVQLYGSASLRLSRDIDLVVPSGQTEASTQHLQRLGYAAIGRDHNALILGHAGTGARLELHESRSPDDFRHGCSVDVLGIAVPTLPVDRAILHAACHGSGHLWSELAWIADMAAAMAAPLDWDRITDLARGKGLRRPLALGCLLASELLEVEIPPPLRPLTDALPASVIAGIAHVTASPAASEREVLAQRGAVGMVLWEMSLYERPARKLALLIRHGHPSATDKALVTLPAALSFLYVPLRLARIAWAWIARR